jgi:hypothetical protein
MSRDPLVIGKRHDKTIQFAAIPDVSGSDVGLIVLLFETAVGAFNVRYIAD